RTDDLAHILANCGATVVVTQATSGGYSYLETLARIMEQKSAPALRHVVVCRSSESLAAPCLSWEALLERGRAGTAAPAPATDVGLMANSLYSSGTTSYPKGVMLSHANLNNAVNLASNLKAHDVTFLSYPLFAITGCHNAVLASLVVGGSLVLQERFEPAGAI